QGVMRAGGCGTPVEMTHPRAPNQTPTEYPDSHRGLTSMKPTALLTWLGLACSATYASAQIPPADRTTVWHPGVLGGVPNRTTVCGVVNASTYGNGASDASSGIQAAVNACPAGQVVQLSAGTFTVNNYILVDKGITLRGAGPTATVLQKTN